MGGAARGCSDGWRRRRRGDRDVGGPDRRSHVAPPPDQTSVLAPTNTIGDRQGVKVVDREVQVPAEIKAAYEKFREGGWPGIASTAD